MNKLIKVFIVTTNIQIVEFVWTKLPASDPPGLDLKNPAVGCGVTLKGVQECLGSGSYASSLLQSPKSVCQWFAMFFVPPYPLSSSLDQYTNSISKRSIPNFSNGKQEQEEKVVFTRTSAGYTDVNGVTGHVKTHRTHSNQWFCLHLMCAKSQTVNGCPACAYQHPPFPFEDIASCVPNVFWTLPLVYTTSVCGIMWPKCGLVVKVGGGQHLGPDPGVSTVMFNLMLRQHKQICQHIL